MIDDDRPSADQVEKEHAMATEHHELMDELQGVFTALVTPFAAPDAAEVDLDRLAANVRQQAAAGVTGVVPCGTTGESPTLSEPEHRAVVEHTIEIARPLGLRVIAGAGSNNTSHAIHLHRFAHAAGADAALHVSPYYNKPSQRGLYEHFSAIADSCSLPVVLYNIPGRTNVAIEIETLELLAQHPNIIAIKEATGSLGNVNHILERTDLIVLSGDDPLTLPMCAVGARGVVSVISNVVPDRVVSLCRAIAEGDWKKAREVHMELLPLARGLLTLDTNPVPVKTALAQVGRDSGLVRLPLAPPGDEAYEQIAQLMGRRNTRSGDETQSTVEVKQAIATHA